MSTEENTQKARFGVGSELSMFTTFNAVPLPDDDNELRKLARMLCEPGMTNEIIGNCVSTGQSRWREAERVIKSDVLNGEVLTRNQSLIMTRCGAATPMETGFLRNLFDSVKSQEDKDLFRGHLFTSLNFINQVKDMPISVARKLADEDSYEAFVDGERSAVYDAFSVNMNNPMYLAAFGRWITNCEWVPISSSDDRHHFSVDTIAEMMYRYLCRLRYYQREFNTKLLNISKAALEEAKKARDAEKKTTTDEATDDAITDAVAGDADEALDISKYCSFTSATGKIKNHVDTYKGLFDHRSALNTEAGLNLDDLSYFNHELWTDLDIDEHYSVAKGAVDSNSEGAIPLEHVQERQDALYKLLHQPANPRQLMIKEHIPVKRPVSCHRFAVVIFIANYNLKPLSKEEEAAAEHETWEEDSDWIGSAQWRIHKRDQVDWDLRHWSGLLNVIFSHDDPQVCQSMGGLVRDAFSNLFDVMIMPSGSLLRFPHYTRPSDSASETAVVKSHPVAADRIASGPSGTLSPL